MNAAKVKHELQRAAKLLDAKRLVEANAVLQVLLRTAPRCYEALFFSGAIAMEEGRLPEAESLLQRAVRENLAAIPGAMRLAITKAKLGKNGEAGKLLEQILQKEPRHAEAWRVLGFVKTVLGSPSEGLVCQQRAVECGPADAASLYQLGESLFLAHRYPESLRCQDQAIQTDPKMAKAHFGRAMALHGLNRIKEAVAAYDRAIELAPGHFNARSYRLMDLHYLSGISRERLFAEHEEFGRSVGQGKVRHFPHVADPTRRIRLAILSPDLRAHSVTYFIEPLLHRLDPNEFELLLYHDHHVVDHVSARLRKRAARWRHVVGIADSEVERMILADAPDVLVELAGHTGFNRLPLLAQRVAPVQISYLGYPDTTGVRAIDYRFVDAISDPVGEADAYSTESLVRLAPTAWTYQPPSDSPAPARKVDETFPGVVFGCFNNFAKLSIELLEAWSQLLQRVPNSKLVLKPSGQFDPSLGGELHVALEAWQVSRDRVQILKGTPEVRDHLALYERIDIALDTFPYHGTTTTCEALWMGVPVVSRRGDRHASRVGASLLTAIGHPEWIAETWDDYIEKAAALASDPIQLANLRAHLREEMQRSPLLDHAGQAKRFGAALRECWATYCHATGQSSI
ncbi:MAG: tetratricopeptide repeat protein [Candidatus Didemnitutus sp.]|nr:tetratricopeptide repeat protein [Candidatus Didemnitutus sp.]